MDDGISQRPAPTGILGKLRNIGPGVVVSGSVVGSGELLVTTRMGAEVGFIFLWGVIFASVIKYFIQTNSQRFLYERIDNNQPEIVEILHFSFH